MLRLKRLLPVIFLSVAVLLISAWDGCGGAAPTPGGIGGGFPVTVQDELIPLNIFTPHSGAVVQGTYLSDAESRAAGSTTPFTVMSDSNGNAFATGRRVYANWNSAILGVCGNSVTGSSANFLDVQPLTGINWICEVDVSAAGSTLSTHFVRPSAQPTTIAFSRGGFTTTYGMPKMYVFGKGSVLASQVTATSVSNLGTTATFPFPKQGTSNLPSALYATEVVNIGSGGVENNVGANFFSVGKEDTTFTSPFGVAVAHVDTTTIVCPPPPPLVENYNPNTGKCTTTKESSNYPVVSQYTLNQVKFKNHVLNVGIEPTAIATYGLQLTTDNDGDGTSIITRQPPNAIVANMGSNSVTIINLVNVSTVATVSVGSQPVALAVKPDNSVAWIVDYGDGTVKEVNLSTYSVVRSVNVGTKPTSVVYDGGAGALWVGGLNYVAKVDLASFTVTSSVGVSGQVTSVGLSAGQGEIVTTTINGSVAAAQEYNTSSRALVASYENGGSATMYNAYSEGGTLPDVCLLALGSVVSVNYSNAISISATPNGFSVVDLSTHAVIMQGNTPTPVRSIGVDASQGIAYLAIPDSNLLLSVPLN